MLLFRIWQSTLFAILMKIPSSEVGGYAILVKPSRTVVDCSADPQEITRKQVFWTDWTRSATNPLCSDTNQKPWILFKGWLLSSLNDPFSLLLFNLFWYRSNRLITWKHMRENIRESSEAYSWINIMRKLIISTPLALSPLLYLFSAKDASLSHVFNPREFTKE